MSVLQEASGKEGSRIIVSNTNFGVFLYFELRLMFFAQICNLSIDGKIIDDIIFFDNIVSTYNIYYAAFTKLWGERNWKLFMGSSRGVKTY